ncbi:MAG TPA: Asp23/Gls24 family envelope stress response protein [Friedmanniella sp.]
MSTVPLTRTTTGDVDEMRRRGRLVLADRVIEKIAGQAAIEVAAASGRSGGFLGLGAESDAHARPKVDVMLSAASADLALAVGIAYPGSIRRATQEVREHVTERVETLTGVDVRRVDIDVTFLDVADGTPRQVLR